MSADRKASFVFVYRVCYQYNGKPLLIKRNTPVDRAVYLTERGGWRYSERSARYLAVEELNATFVLQLNDVWNSPTEREE